MIKSKPNLAPLKSIAIKTQREKGVLIIGGAGFIGVNLANRLLAQGQRVLIYDNLSRQGAATNLKWLMSKYPDVEVTIADINDSDNLKKGIDEAEQIYHFAAQASVSHNFKFPEPDYDISIGGTIRILEAIRKSSHKPSMIFTSSRKIYGDLSAIELQCDEHKYYPTNLSVSKYGINETYPLQLNTPYAISKGAADQYILDYARSYSLRNVVFRLSCVYGPYQSGTEDQGWVGHFITQYLKNNKLILYGDGKQVRDILFIEDLIDAFLLARKHFNSITGQAFNIGGGPENAISLIEFLSQMTRIDHLNLNISFDSWRSGDQKYYVSDIRKFKKKTGWTPKISYFEGLIYMYSWLYHYNETHTAKALIGS